MASNSVISLGIQVEGESTFKSALSAIDAEIKSLGAGVEAATASMGKMGDNEEAAAKKSQLLGQQVEANQKKLEILSQQYDAANKHLEELAKAMEDAKKSGDPEAIEKATNAYNKQSVQVSKLSTEMSKTEKAIADANEKMQEGEKAATDEGKAMEEAGKQSDDLGGKVDKMAKIMTAEFAAKAASAVIDGLKNIADKAIEAGKKIYELTTEAGAYADTMLTLAATTNVDVVDLEKWEYASQFIDTSVQTLTGSMKKLETNMVSSNKAAGDALAQLGVSATDASGHFRSAEDVMWDAIDALGGIQDQTERDALAMALFGKSASELNPVIESGSAAFKQLGDDAEAAGLILSGDTMNSLGAVDDAVNKMKSSVTAATRNIAAAFAPAVTELTEGASDVVTAFVGMVQGTEGSSQKFQEAIGNLVDNALRILGDMLPKILETGVKVIQSLVQGITSKISDITKTITNVVSELLKTLFKYLPDIIKSGVDIILALIEGIIDAIPELAANIPQIIGAIVSGLAKLGPKLLEAGVNIVKGLAEGILSAVGWLWEQIKKALGSVFGWVLDLLGIHSPSTVMRDKVGKMLGLGVAEGISESAGAVEKAFDDMLPDPDELAASIDGYSVAARVAGAKTGGDAETAPEMFQDNRPIIITLNDRELGRAVRGYV